MSILDARAHIHRYTFEFLRIIDDLRHPPQMREFAIRAIAGAAIYCVFEEHLMTEALRVMQGAIDRDDDLPLLLVHSLEAPVSLDARFAAGLVRLGERAFERGRIIALARITKTLVTQCHGGSTEDFVVPSRWIRRLVEQTTPEDADFILRCAVSAWFRDERSDVEGIGDLIPDASAWDDYV